MGILSSVNWSEVETSGSVLPEGTYNLTVLKAEEKTNDEKGNTWISLFLKVADGDQEGKTVNSNLYVECGSASTPEKRKTAEAIAKSQIKTLFANNGLSQLDSVSDLVGMTSPARVKVTKSEQYGDGNQVNFIPVKKTDLSAAPF